MPTLTEDLTFQLDDDGVTLNTSTASFPFVDIDTVTGLDSAPFRTSQRDHEGQDGGFVDAEFETGRDIVLAGTVYADSDEMETFLDTLLDNWRPRTTRVPFYVKAPGVDERVLFVKSLGCAYDWDSLRRTGMAAVKFSAYAEDPRKYTNVLNSVGLQQGSTITTGRSYNKSYNFGYGTIILVPDSVIVNVGGNRLAPAVITIQGPVTNPQIVNDTVGLTLQVNIVLGVGDTLTIDLLNHTILLNGSANRRGSLQAPNWWLLQKGQNILRFRAGVAGTASATITWRDAWR